MADHNRLYPTPQVSTSGLQHESNLTSFEDFFIERAHQAALHMHFNQAVAASLTLDWYMAFGPCPTLEQAEVLRKMTAYECYAYTHGASMPPPVEQPLARPYAFHKNSTVKNVGIVKESNLQAVKAMVIAVLLALPIWAVVIFCADLFWNAVKHLGVR